MEFGQPRNRLSIERCPVCDGKTDVRVEQHAAPDGWHRRQGSLLKLALALGVLILIALGINIYLTVQKNNLQRHYEQHTGK